MEHVILSVIFGHLVEDFFLQTKSMADNKNRFGFKGFAWCTLHVLVYTLTVAIFVGNADPLFLFGAFLPHWLIDKWSLAFQWMRLIGRGDLLSDKDSKNFSLGIIIYIVIDQTIHFGCLWLLLKII
ncbi:DUF3307 domain-containing protein [Candidatus Falkowbacteria bacterium]|nr:DUF3307 domain-containing protein [Candidatus Falkowbacteria bacterium]